MVSRELDVCREGESAERSTPNAVDSGGSNFAMSTNRTGDMQNLANVAGKELC
jgi:hypothetical protein